MYQIFVVMMFEKVQLTKILFHESICLRWQLDFDLQPYFRELTREKGLAT